MVRVCGAAREGGLAVPGDAKLSGRARNKYGPGLTRHPAPMKRNRVKKAETIMSFGLTINI